MKTNAGVWIAISVVLIIIGIILFVGVMLMHGWDFSKLNIDESVTNTYQISEIIHSISIDTDTADIEFALSDDGQCRVVCHESEKLKHSVDTYDDILRIKLVDERSWYEYIGFNFKKPKITIYLSKAEYKSLIVNENTGDIYIPYFYTFDKIDILLTTGNVTSYASATDMIKIESSTGDITVGGVSTANLDLTVSTGSITVLDTSCSGDIRVNVSTGKANISDVVCDNLYSAGSTGDLTLKNVIASGTFVFNRSTGDIKFDSCDAASINVVTDTGDVSGSLLSEKVFIVRSDTGRIDVPNTINGGRCEITTDTGNIKITLN